MKMDDQHQQVNAEAIISSLTAKNLEMEEQINQMKLDMHELEQLHQMDEEIIEMQKETEKELQQHNQELALAIAMLNQQVAELEARLEGQMNAEEIVTSLTAKNLDLEEQNKNIKLDNYELEQLHQMDEEIIETQKETEKELQLKNEEQMMDIAALRRQLTEWESRAVDYERAILKFRQKTADLNEEVQNQRDELATMRAREEEKARAAGAEISLLTNANRTFAEIVEAELNSIELKFARQQIGHMRSFLPDNFTKAGGDNDCLVLCVLFPRLSAKAHALAHLLQQKYPQAPGGMRREHVTLSHRGEQWAHVRHFGYQLQQLHTALHKFIAVFKNCSAERLSRLAVQQMEAAQRETRLEEYFKLLQQNRFDENTSIEQLEQICKYFQRLFSANLSTEQFNGREDLRNTLVQIREGLGWIQFNGQRLRHYLLADSPTAASGTGSSSNSSNAHTPAGDAPLTASMHSSSLLMAKSMTGSGIGGTNADLEFAAFVERLAQLLGECEQLAMRALNRIPVDNELILTPELHDRLLSAIAALEKCGRIVQQSCGMATSQLGAVDSEGLPAQQMLEFVLSSVEKFIGQVDGHHRRAHAQIFESLESIKSVLDGLSEALENSSMEIPPSQKSTTANDSGFPPLQDRAHSRKQDAVEAESLRWQVAKKDEELVRLQKALKAREQDIGTIKLRLDMAEKQLAENAAGGALNAEIHRLKAECGQLQEELQRQKEDFAQQLATLQAQLAESESERKKEQERTREFSKKALFANLHMQQQQQQSQQMPSATSTSSSTPSAVVDGQMLADGVGDVQQVLGELRLAQEKIRILEGQHPSPGGLTLGTDSTLVPCPACAEREEGQQLELAEMVRQSEALMRASDQLLRPIDPRKMDKYRRAVDDINFRAESLRIRFHRFWRKYRPNQPMPTLLWPLASGVQKGQSNSDDPESMERRLQAGSTQPRRAFATTA